LDTWFLQICEQTDKQTDNCTLTAILPNPTGGEVIRPITTVTQLSYVTSTPVNSRPHPNHKLNP